MPGCKQSTIDTERFGDFTVVQCIANKNHALWRAELLNEQFAALDLAVCCDVIEPRDFVEMRVDAKVDNNFEQRVFFVGRQNRLLLSGVFQQRQQFGGSRVQSSFEAPLIVRRGKLMAEFRKRVACEGKASRS